MGSRCETGAVPATVSGGPLPWNGGIGQRPASQETCLRRRPRPAGTSQRCVALRGLAPRGTSEATPVVAFRRKPCPIDLLFATATLATPNILVTGSREAVGPTTPRYRDESSIKRRSRTWHCPQRRTCSARPGVRLDHRPRGTQTTQDPRRRGHHTLLFVDGIRFNDRRLGNEARSRRLTTDLLSRIEVVRGPHPPCGAPKRWAASSPSRRPIRSGRAGLRALANMAASTATAVRPLRLGWGIARHRRRGRMATQRRNRLVWRRGERGRFRDRLGKPQGAPSKRPARDRAVGHDRGPQRIRRLRPPHLPARRYARRDAEPDRRRPRLATLPRAAGSCARRPVISTAPTATALPAHP